MTGPVAPAVPSTILAVHNRYKQHGGEDVVFDAETALLEAHGHRVERFVVDNEQIDERPGFGEALGLAARTVWSVRAARVLRNRVRRLRPDLVHVHNFFPLLSPSIYSACRSEGAAVVQTLHNYRLVCPVATLYRDGHPCEDCLGRAFAWPGIIHACYRESASASAAVATMLAFHRARRTWSRDVDLYVAVSAFLRSKLVEGLLEPDRVVVKPNFVRGTAEPGSNPDGPFLYVGRLSPDKGIETLLEAWAHVPSHVNLRIVGDGPLGPTVRAAAERLPNIEAAGRIPHLAVPEELRSGRALIFPSRWYEGLPVSIMEAFEAGLPVIGSRLGAVEEVIADGENGLLFEPGDAEGLAGHVRWLVDHEPARARLAEDARSTYLERYTPEINYGLMLDVYRTALARRQHRRPERPASAESTAPDGSAIR